MHLAPNVGFLGPRDAGKAPFAHHRLEQDSSHRKCRFSIYETRQVKMLNFYRVIGFPFAMFVVAPSVIGSIVLTIILIFKIFSGSIKFMDIFSKTIKEIIPSYHFGKIEILLYAELTPFYFYIITVIIVLIFNTIYYAMIGAESESIKKD
jgi:hypothetical protein